MTTEPNQRRHPREARRIPAVLETEGAALPGRIENIGQGGAFFTTDLLEGSAAEGDRVVLRFDENGGETALSGIVLRVERYFHEGELYRALAIRFDAPYAPAP